MIYLIILSGLEKDFSSLLDTADFIYPLQPRLLWLGHISETLRENFTLQRILAVAACYSLLKQDGRGKKKKKDEQLVGYVRLPSARFFLSPVPHQACTGFLHCFLPYPLSPRRMPGRCKGCICGTGFSVSSSHH